MKNKKTEKYWLVRGYNHGEVDYEEVILAACKEDAAKAFCDKYNWYRHFEKVTCVVRPPLRTWVVVYDDIDRYCPRDGLELEITSYSEADMRHQLYKKLCCGPDPVHIHSVTEKKA